MTQISSYQREPQYGTALGTAIAGGVAWGGMEYLMKKKPFLDKDEKLQDSFVKEMEDALTKIKDSDTLKVVESQNNIEKEIDALVTSDELKEFITKRKDDFSKLSDDELNLLKNKIGSTEPNDAKSLLKYTFKREGKYYNHFNDVFESCYNEAGKLKHNADKISKENWSAIKSVITDARVKSGMKAGVTFATIAAIISCGAEYFFSRKN